MIATDREIEELQDQAVGEFVNEQIRNSRKTI